MSSSDDRDGSTVGNEWLSPDQSPASRPTVHHPMAEACIDLGFGLSNYGIEQSGAEVGQAIERWSGREPEGGYRVDLYGLPCAMEGEGRADPGVYARLVSAEEAGRTAEGTERLVLEKTSDGNWTVHPQEKYPDAMDAWSAVSAFAELATALLGAVDPSECRFRIVPANRMVAADIHRGLAIWEAGYDPARRHETVSSSDYERPAF